MTRQQQLSRAKAAMAAVDLTALNDAQLDAVSAFLEAMSPERDGRKVAPVLMLHRARHQGRSTPA